MAITTTEWLLPPDRADFFFGRGSRTYIPGTIWVIVLRDQHILTGAWSRVTSHGRHLQHLLHGILTQHIEFEEEPCATLVALIH